MPYRRLDGQTDELTCRFAGPCFATALGLRIIDACIANERKATNGSLGFQTLGFPKQIIFNASIDKFGKLFFESSEGDRRVANRSTKTRAPMG